MTTEDTYGVPFPSREEVENGELVPNENLKQLWDEQENKK